MIYYYLTLLIWLVCFAVVLILFTSKMELKKICKITLVYTLLNFIRVFPYFKIGTYNWTGNILIVVSIFILFLVFRRKDNISINIKPKSKVTIIGLIIYLLMILLIFIVKQQYKSENLEYFLLLALLAGISEELQFRGYLSTYLKSNINFKKSSILGIPTYVIASSVGFALIHIFPFMPNNNFGLIFIRTFTLGIVLDMVYKRTKNIIIPILLHNFVNVIFYIALAS